MFVKAIYKNKGKLYLAASKNVLMMMNRIVVLFLAVGLLWSCNDDDNGAAPPPEPPRPLSEVLAEDEAEIQEYLRTHYYNYAEFQNPPEDFDFKIRINEIPEGNTELIPLIDSVKTEVIELSSSDFGIEAVDETNVEHTVYYLTARQGAGKIPTVADSVFLKYEGILLDNTEFDSSTDYLWQYLPFFLRGYANGIAKLRAGGEVITEDDGTFTISDTGIGFVIMPSALAYYNSARGSIPAYSPLLFKVELGTFVENTDYDNDGIPSIQEDVDQDGNLNDDNTDEDFSSSGPISNHIDSDDDNDGRPTRDEIDIDAQGNVTFRDSDGDGTPDHLDEDS